MKVIAIGNSFSQDATRYLHEIASSAGADMKVVNLYIGGCSLFKHYVNAVTDKKCYLMEFNGYNTGFEVSIKEALLSDRWDAVTLQQVSYESVDYNSYQPYLSYMRRYIEKYSPQAKVYIHQTWAYEQGSKRLCSELGYSDYNDMLADIKKANAQAVRDIHADGIIASGELFDRLIKEGVSKIHRDTFHATLGVGRYALGLLWYSTLTGNDISEISFDKTDESISEIENETIKAAVQFIKNRSIIPTNNAVVEWSIK